MTEKHKAFCEYMRFLTALSTSSIVLLILFIERLEAQHEQGHMVTLALIAFMVCGITSVIAYSLTIINFDENISFGKIDLSIVAIVMTWGSFITAISALVVFGWANLY